jgi:hypothetical protein
MTYYWLILSIGIALGWLIGSPTIKQTRRITRLVLIRGRTSKPRMAWVDSESPNGLDDMEDCIVAAFVRGRLTASEVNCYDDVRRALGERRAA